MNDRRNAVFLEEMGVGQQWRLRHRAQAAEPAPLAPVEATAAHAHPVGQAGAMPDVTNAPSASAAMSPSAPHAPHAAAASGEMPVPERDAAHSPAAFAASPASAVQPPHAAAAARTASAAEAGTGDTSTATRAASQGAPAGPADSASAAMQDAATVPARVPGTPSIASTGEDMSWFDDAPTPEYKPQRKKTAAEPAQSSAMQPQRPAPAASPARPAQMPAPAARPAMPASPAAPAQRAPQQARAAAAAPPTMADEAPAYDEMPVDQPPAWFDDDLEAASPAARATDPAAGRAPASGRATDEEIAAMDWPALQAAIGSCTRCARCATRQQAIPGRGDEQATWLALDTAPGNAEDSEGYQFAGEAGYLLDNMLKAVGQTTEKGAYLTSLVKCHAPHAPSAEELQACRPYLERELALTQAKVIVTFGHSAGKGLLGAAARGRIMMHGSVPVVATYHPADLLKKPEEKAKAWQDLCLAKAAHAGRR